MPRIRLERIEFGYYDPKTKSETVVFPSLNAEFPSGEISMVLGASGEGKTTLLSLIAGIFDYGGHIYYDSLLVDDVHPKDRNIALVRQDLALYPRLSVFENIAFPLKVLHAKPDEIRSRVFGIAKELEIEACLTRFPSEISLGQKQRVALARALIKNPSLVLLDEPFSNLPEGSRASYYRLLLDAKKAYGTTFIVVTHKIEEAVSFGDRIYLMKEGSFAFEGTPREFQTSEDSAVVSFRRESEDA